MAPAAINTLVLESVTFEESLLLRLTVTPPAGAAAPSVTGKLTVCPSVREVPLGRPIVPVLTTVTVAETSP